MNNKDNMKPYFTKKQMKKFFDHIDSFRKPNVIVNGKPLVNPNQILEQLLCINEVHQAIDISGKFSIILADKSTITRLPILFTISKTGIVTHKKLSEKLKSGVFNHPVIF